MPPAVAAGALASVRYLKTSEVERSRQQTLAERLKRMLGEAGLPVMPNESHIVPVLIGDPVRCRQVTDELLERHRIYVQPINYPTVPRGTERLRLTPTPLHREEDLAHLVASLREVWSRFLAPLRGLNRGARASGPSVRPLGRARPRVSTARGRRNFRR